MIVYKDEERVVDARVMVVVLDKQATTPSDARLKLHKRSGIEESGRPMRYEMESTKKWLSVFQPDNV